MHLIFSMQGCSVPLCFEWAKSDLGMILLLSGQGKRLGGEGGGVRILKSVRSEPLYTNLSGFFFTHLPLCFFQYVCLFYFSFAGLQPRGSKAEDKLRKLVCIEIREVMNKISMDNKLIEGHFLLKEESICRKQMSPLYLR